ncbi:MAG: NADH-quinone oxidoreductase subunit C [Desulfurococcales archaeon]|nr:NADH-quinone oxidoreductase subunit C [Desulfurococcales archaeon]MCE4605567.1 NADH-quinone oxidoreductase subunit C [Desulfurococcales archaeon]
MDLAQARKIVEEALSGIEARVEEGRGFIEFIVSKENLVEAASRLKKAGFDHVKSLTVVDYKAEGKFKIVYYVSSYLNEDLAGVIVGIGTEVPRDNPKMPTLVYVWRSAEFQEREVFEFFGIDFEDHPDLRLLLLTPQVAEKRPLRKDFIVKEEPIIRTTPPTG